MHVCTQNSSALTDWSRYWEPSRHTNLQNLYFHLFIYIKLRLFVIYNPHSFSRRFCGAIRSLAHSFLFNFVLPRFRCVRTNFAIRSQMPVNLLIERIVISMFNGEGVGDLLRYASTTDRINPRFKAHREHKTHSVSHSERHWTHIFAGIPRFLIFVILLNLNVFVFLFICVYCDGKTSFPLVKLIWMTLLRGLIESC